MDIEAQIADYIRGNRETYTREAITQELLDAGYKADEIDAGWKLVEQEDAEAIVHTRPRVVTGRSGWFALLWVFIIIIGVILLFLTDLVLAFSYSYSSASALGYFVNLGSLLVFVGLVVANVVLLRRNWPYRRVVALTAATALLWFLALTGTCLYGPRILG